jgi:hypothetical protein
VGKLIKYEFVLRGKRMLVFLAAASLLNLGLYLYLRFAADTIESVSAAVTFFFLFMLFNVFFALLFLDILTSFSRELNHKEGYMLFMAPRDGWQIIGGKLLSGLLEGLGFLIFFLALAYANLFVAYGATVRALVLEALNQFFGFTPQQQSAAVVTFIVFALLFLVSVINAVTTAYAAMTLRRGFFSHLRAGWIVTSLTYVVLGLVISLLMLLATKVYPLPTPMDILDASVRLDYLRDLDQCLIVYAMVLAAITVLVFYGTGYLLEKKVDF